MEVHHHAHTARKRFTHYLWEFLMLFLAVFCGFLAENIREHQIEHARAKQYAASLVKDLENDVIAIRRQNKLNVRYNSIVDSTLQLSKGKLEGQAASKFAFYTRFCYWTAPIIWSRATFDQIRNSGNLRYFQNYQLLKNLIEYDGILSRIRAEADAHGIRGNKMLETINDILEPEINYQLSKYYIYDLDTMSQATKGKFFSMNHPSLENKRGQVTQMLNMAIVQQRNLRNNNAVTHRSSEALALKLIEEVKEEYHLK